MATNAEQTADQLISQLNQQLNENEDAQTAIAVYKTANWVINQLDEVKQAALQLAEQELRENQAEAYRAPAGSAGWTMPRAQQLNEEKWLKALASDPDLIRIQREFDQAQAALHQAQRPFMELPDPRFFIR